MSSAEGDPPDPDDGPPERARPEPTAGRGAWLVIGGIVVILLVVLGLILFGNSDDVDTAADDPVVESAPPESTPPDSAPTTTAPPPTSAPATTVSEPPAPAPRTSFEGEGVYRVGEDIAPGTYRQDGGSGPCFWSRLAELTGKSDAQIDSSLTEGPSQVTIAGTDRFFQTHGCGTWNKVG